MKKTLKATELVFIKGGHHGSGNGSSLSQKSNLHTVSNNNKRLIPVIVPTSGSSSTQ